jgi:hypothetical protein
MPSLSELRQWIRRLGLPYVARLFRVTPQTVRRWLRDGIPRARRDQVNRVFGRKKPKTPKKRVQSRPKKAKRKSKAKKRVRQIVPPESRPGGESRIVTNREALCERLNRYTRRYIAQNPNRNNIAPGYREYDRAYIVHRGIQEGLMLIRRVMVTATERNNLRMLRQIEKDAVSLLNALPRAELYITFSLFEYGSQFVGYSPSPSLLSDDDGSLVITYSTNRGESALKSFLQWVKNELSRFANSERSCVKIESYTMRVYR